MMNHSPAQIDKDLTIRYCEDHARRINGGQGELVLQEVERDLLRMDPLARTRIEFFMRGARFTKEWFAQHAKPAPPREPSWIPAYGRVLFLMVALFVAVYAGRAWGQSENPAYRPDPEVAQR